MAKSKTLTPKQTPNNITKPCYAMAFLDDNSAEITMYGDVVEKQPMDWWTGKPIDGEYIIQDEFLADLKEIEHCSKITIHLNSLGGDAGVGLLIHNKLRDLADNGKELVCIVDAVAMSAGSLIMSACDTVKLHPSSIIMVHKCWGSCFGGYNADQLREQAKMLDAWDKAQISIYSRKTGLSDTEISHLMSKETYMIGKEAVEKGFADELIEGENTMSISASADRTIIYANGHAFRMPRGITVPEQIPITASATTEDAIKTTPNNGGNEEGGNPTMATNLEELRKENAELAAQVEADVRASMKSDNNDVAQAVAAERQRLSEIDAIAALYDDETVKAAKYGDKPCSAADMAYQAALKQAEKGNAFMASAKKDAEAAAKVNAAPNAPEETKPQTEEEKMAAARADIKAALKKEDK